MSFTGIKPTSRHAAASDAAHLGSGKQERTPSSRESARHRRSLGLFVPGIAPERHSLLRVDIRRILPAEGCSDPPAALLLRKIYIVQVENIFVQALI